MKIIDREKKRVLRIDCGSEDIRLMASRLGPVGIGSPEFRVVKHLIPHHCEFFGEGDQLLGLLYYCFQHNRLELIGSVGIDWEWK